MGWRFFLFDGLRTALPRVSIKLATVVTISNTVNLMQRFAVIATEA